nr:hypothetical protein [Pirellula sp.]
MRFLLSFAVLFCLDFSLGLMPVSQAQPTRGIGLDPEEAFRIQREQLVENVLVPGGVSNQRVLESSRTTLRHKFLPKQHHDKAYQDIAIAIGGNQTISSPFIVALMTQELDPQPTDKVLEIGTGSGYQAAILSPIV